MSLREDRFHLFIEYFNNAKFMSAQTTLDEVWLAEEGIERDFLGGMIQLAVSMYHLTNGNPQGSKKIYEKAKGMLEKYGELHQGLNLKKIKSDLDHLFLNNLKPEHTDVDYLKLIPKLDFKV